MNLLNIENILFSVVLFVPSLYLWNRLYTNYVRFKKEFEDEKLFYERHNCFLMYSRKYIKGWPPTYTIKIDINNLNLFLEPYLYFINTSKYTLDIAVMSFAINPLFDALHEAIKKGVKVRLIVNFLSVKTMNMKYNNLMKAGVEIAFYVDKTEKLNYIMHSKFMVKDYNSCSGFLCMGSMNFTGISTILNNYENVVFTSNMYIVESFHKNFEKCWKMIKRDNKHIFNRTILTDAGFIQ
ncbi:PLDc 2 domain containing protein [Asbolus verrucosus]|uniref:Mitochondrial cardiolipin hydrolase n=1 Tax=Asbolus verrucosus TaxID=1661398 RepID=A0A482VXZ2_ASBVE|nr:PLDc 2 domain containing protein [Asbolus verrucosus]